MVFSPKALAVSAGQWLRLFFCGLCMGSADLIPGISGGTIAFVMGFYEPLIESLKTINLDSFKLLLTFQFRRFSQVFAWRFLIPLGCGIATAFILLAGLFYQILGDPTYRVYLYAAFFGLVVASFVFCAKQVKVWNGTQVVSLAVGAIIAHLLTGTTLAPEALETPYAVQVAIAEPAVPLENYIPEKHLLTGLTPETLGAMVAKGTIQLDEPLIGPDGQPLGIVKDVVEMHRGWGIDLWLVGAGAVAITAMLLPGISGSYLLTLLGSYAMVIGALVDFIESAKQLVFDRDAFFILLSLAIGIVIGLMLFVRCISWLLKHRHDLTIAALVGFMIGSLRSVWPFWSYQYVLDPLKLLKGPQLQPVDTLWPELNSLLFWKAALWMAAGFLLVFIIELLASAKNSEKKLGKKGVESV